MFLVCEEAFKNPSIYCTENGLYFKIHLNKGGSKQTKQNLLCFPRC